MSDGSGRAIRFDLASNAASVVKGVSAGEVPLAMNVTATAGLDVADDEVGLASNGGDAHALVPGAADVVP